MAFLHSTHTVHWKSYDTEKDRSLLSANVIGAPKTALVFGPFCQHFITLEVRFKKYI